VACLAAAAAGRARIYLGVHFRADLLTSVPAGLLAAGFARAIVPPVQRWVAPSTEHIYDALLSLLPHRRRPPPPLSAWRPDWEVPTLGQGCPNLARAMVTRSHPQLEAGAHSWRDRAMATIAGTGPARDLRGSLPPHPATISKIAAITFGFWVAKVIATTLGETAGDFVAQTLGLGYVVGTIVTTVLLVAVLFAQVRSNTYRPVLFWAAIVGTTTAGTEISDMMDRTFGLGYVAGSSILLGGLMLTLAVWYVRKGTLSVDPIADKESELLFWGAVTFSNSLGTAFGDALIDPIGMSFVQGALVCLGVIAAVLLLHYLTRINGVPLFWAAFVFTRPFGATFGNFLTKEHARGGLELGTLATSLVAAALLVAVVLVSSRIDSRRRVGSGTAQAFGPGM